MTVSLLGYDRGSTGQVPGQGQGSTTVFLFPEGASQELDRPTVLDIRPVLMADADSDNEARSLKMFAAIAFEPEGPSDRQIQFLVKRPISLAGSRIALPKGTVKALEIVQEQLVTGLNGGTPVRYVHSFVNKERTYPFEAVDTFNYDAVISTDTFAAIPDYATRVGIASYIGGSARITFRTRFGRTIYISGSVNADGGTLWYPVPPNADQYALSATVASGRMHTVIWSGYR